MNVDDFFKKAEAYIWEGNFAVLKSKRTYSHAFANIIDKNETTVIIEQSKINMEDAYEMEKGWKIITFDMILPFGLIGFLAKISGALADKEISLLAVSSYSTDHILVKKRDIVKAVDCLKSLGIKINKREMNNHNKSNWKK